MSFNYGHNLGVIPGERFHFERRLGSSIQDLGDFDVDASWSIAEGGFYGSFVGDVVDLLPPDPFGMNVATTFEAIAGFQDEFQGDDDSWLTQLALEWERDEPEFGIYGSDLFAGLNVRSGKFTFIPGDSNSSSRVNEKPPSFPAFSLGGGGVQKFLNFSYEADLADTFPVEEALYASSFSRASSARTFCEPEGDAPHDAMFYALAYLGTQDLLSAERVCKSFNDAIKNDPLLWTDFQIDHPLNSKITDDDLVKLTDRANGQIKSLTLMSCVKITENGLKRVLERNPGLTKLSIPGCIKISIEGILTTLKSAGARGVKQLRIGERYFMMKEEEYEELRVFLEKQHPSVPHKPRYYPSGYLFLSDDDDRALDVEKCPRCQKLRLVYDCPVENCQNNQGSQSCRACYHCIRRCIYCARCIFDYDYDETFNLQAVCPNCRLKKVSCEERQRKEGAPFFKHPVFSRETQCHICLYG